MTQQAQRRDQFTLPIRCTQCGQVGSVAREDAGQDRSAGLRRTLIRLSSGFFLGEGSTQSGDPQIVCDRCETTVVD